MSIVSDLIIPLLLSINARFPYLKNNKKKKFFSSMLLSVSLFSCYCWRHLSIIVFLLLFQSPFFFSSHFSLTVFCPLHSSFSMYLPHFLFSSFFSIYWFLVRPYSPYMVDLVFNCSCCVFLLIGFLSLFL